jgi:hypothetical protein
MTFNTIIKKIKDKKNDNIYTPLSVVKIMIEMCDIKPSDKVLDCSLGGGIFYDNLPECDKDWCEIDKGRDFFMCNNKYDLIIGNPPYSMWSKWLEHTTKLTDRFCYIFGTLNITDARIRDLAKKGYGITKIHLLKIDWWFAMSYLILFEKNKPSIMSVSENRICCDVCNKNCKRGRNGKDYNVCTTLKL